jgi:fructokinase
MSPADPLILVAGEALYDTWVDEAGEMHGRPGGGPFNAARTIARLRQPVAYLGRLSRDPAGAALERMLRDDGVGLDATVRTDDPTTLALADIGPDGSARFTFYERGTSAPGLVPAEALAAVAALAAPVGVLHVGTLGLTLEPVAAATEAVVDRLAGEALVFVDPNCRPWAIADPAAYRARLNRVLARGDVVKVSDDDLAFLDPDRSAEDAARALLDHGPAVALLTRGADGVLAVTGAGSFAVGAPHADVVDTIGAGDAFGGGFLAWWRGHGLGAAELADTDRVLQATAFGAAVAARTCERAGAAPPFLEELDGALLR